MSLLAMRQPFSSTQITDYVVGPDGALGSIHARSQKLQSVEQKKLRDVIAVSINEFAQELLTKGEKQQAANQYLRFVNEFPKMTKRRQLSLRRLKSLSNLNKRNRLFSSISASLSRMERRSRRRVHIGS